MKVSAAVDMLVQIIAAPAIIHTGINVPRIMGTVGIKSITSGIHDIS
jgi:hypothetical protein